MSICPICKKEIDGEDLATICPQCKQQYHYKCWNYNGGCTNIDCDFYNDEYDESVAKAEQKKSQRQTEEQKFLKEQEQRRKYYEEQREEKLRKEAFKKEQQKAQYASAENDSKTSSFMHLFSNIGVRIMRLAEILFVIDIVITVVIALWILIYAMAFKMYWLAFLTPVVVLIGIVSNYILCIFLFGFGRLVDNSDRQLEEMRRNK